MLLAINPDNRGFNLDFGFVKLLTHYGFEIDLDYDIIEILFQLRPFSNIFIFSINIFHINGK
jgi:hypothetical protein